MWKESLSVSRYFKIIFPNISFVAHDITIWIVFLDGSIPTIEKIIKGDTAI